MLTTTVTSSRTTTPGFPTVGLSYPDTWIAPMNPHAESVERRTEEWLRGIGVIRDEEGATRFRRLAVGAYGGRPFPLADAEKLETITSFLALWIYYDDLIEGVGEERTAMVAAALRGEPSSLDGAAPCLRGLWELGRRFRAQMSQRWMERLSDRYTDWLGTVAREAVFAKRYQEVGVPPTVDAHLALRAINIGVLPTLSFVEYEMGRELPAAIAEHPQLRRVERLCAKVVILQNDLVGYSKDREAMWPNVVSSLSAERGISIGAAFAEAAAMHDGFVRSLRSAEAALLADAGDAEVVVPWLRRVGHLMHGFARWHTTAGRYRSVHTLPDGSQMGLLVGRIAG